jgi:ribosome-dependent ATPase
MIHEPDLLILDEPTSGVDPLARDRFWELLIDLARNRGVTIFLSTHFMNEAERCDRVSLMYGGRVLAQGTPESIVKDAGAKDLEDAFVGQLLRTAGTRVAPGAADLRESATETRSARRGGLAWHRLWAYALRETLEIWRDRIRLAFATLGPVVLMIVFGFGITFDVEGLNYAALDFDRSPDSRAYLESFAGTKYFQLRAPARDAEDLENRMRSGELRFGIEIPPGFGRDLRSGRAPEVGIWLDGAFPFRAETMQGYVAGVHQAYLERLAGHSVRSRPAPPANVEARFRYNQEFRSVFAMVPGIVMLLLMFIPAIMTSLAIVREKELGSIVNFYVTPTSRLEYLLGKQLPYVAIALLNFATLLLLALVVFRVPVKGSFGALCFGAILYTIASTGIGLLVASFVRTQIAAILAAAIGTTLPAIQYSGFMLPVSSMSTDAQIFGRAFPSTYFLHMSVGVFNKGLELSAMLVDLAALAAIAIVVTALARAALSEQES